MFISTVHDPATDANDALMREVLARSDGRRKGNELLFRCPLDGHPDEHPSARWNPQKRTWYCDVCGGGGSERDLAERLGGDRSDPQLRFGTPREKIVATYDYPGRDGRLLHQTVRFKPKSFRALLTMVVR
jgi:hypothetical protein